ncbi:unnamed protein product [Arctia plantaginis]|uniref:V-type proton ATPase subunit S1/VOA1 transmembrane domain-containing protein n=1 Tax=Arctia plantaginis TaxID=874455 RepID=A0A8S0YT62_ARCPL|nr:unnamed protein product [Arctia plantaginis]
MHYKVRFILLFLYSVQANLEGPFLFFGSKSLEKYKRPALTYLDQDDLMRIYGEAEAIVVFNNQDSVPLSSLYFPRLRKMLEGQTTLVLPQDFLDVHPDYISNETQVLTLEGPWSERDAQMTETFARLQDIYGAGKVLGILGNSVSQSQSVDYVDGEPWSRVRRQAFTNDSISTPDEDKPQKRQRHALYNATGPAGKALLYSSGWPELRRINGTTIRLSTPVGSPTIKPTRLYTMLVVRFVNTESKDPKDKITLEFSFKQSAGWWTAVGVEVKFNLETTGLSLTAPPPSDAPSAVLGRSYRCSLPLVYSSDEATLTLPNIHVQMFMDSTEAFDDAFDCIGFTTVPIWSGLLATFVTLIFLGVTISMIMDIKTMDCFETNRSRQLTITVTE